MAGEVVTDKELLALLNATDEEMTKPDYAAAEKKYVAKKKRRDDAKMAGKLAKGIRRQEAEEMREKGFY